MNSSVMEHHGNLRKYSGQICGDQKKKELFGFKTKLANTKRVFKKAC